MFVHCQNSVTLNLFLLLLLACSRVLGNVGHTSPPSHSLSSIPVLCLQFASSSSAFTMSLSIHPSHLSCLPLFPKPPCIIAFFIHIFYAFLYVPFAPPPDHLPSGRLWENITQHTGALSIRHNVKQMSSNSRNTVFIDHSVVMGRTHLWRKCVRETPKQCRCQSLSVSVLVVFCIVLNLLWTQITANDSSQPTTVSCTNTQS